LQTLYYINFYIYSIKYKTSKYSCKIPLRAASSIIIRCNILAKNNKRTYITLYRAASSIIIRYNILAKNNKRTYITLYRAASSIIIRYNIRVIYKYLLTILLRALIVLVYKKYFL
jgi:hypothetical protein